MLNQIWRLILPRKMILPFLKERKRNLGRLSPRTLLIHVLLVPRKTNPRVQNVLVLTGESRLSLTHPTDSGTRIQSLKAHVLQSSPLKILTLIQALLKWVRVLSKSQPDLLILKSQMFQTLSLKGVVIPYLLNRPLTHTMLLMQMGEGRMVDGM